MKIKHSKNTKHTVYLHQCNNKKSKLKTNIFGAGPVNMLNTHKYIHGQLNEHIKYTQAYLGLT
jgi:hypothetical protein